MKPVMRCRASRPWRSSSSSSGRADAASRANSVATPGGETNTWVRAMSIASRARSCGSSRAA